MGFSVYLNKHTEKQTSLFANFLWHSVYTTIHSCVKHMCNNTFIQMRSCKGRLYTSVPVVAVREGTHENEISRWQLRIFQGSVRLPRGTPLTWAVPHYAPTTIAAGAGASYLVFPQETHLLQEVTSATIPPATMTFPGAASRHPLKSPKGEGRRDCSEESEKKINKKKNNDNEEIIPRATTPGRPSTWQGGAGREVLALTHPLEALKGRMRRVALEA